MIATSQTAAELLAELAAAGVTARVDGRSRLHLAGPLTDDLLQRAKAHKPELVQAVRLSRCDRCGSTVFKDTKIHDARSTRRDCAQCGRTAGFPRWYGLSTTKATKASERAIAGGHGSLKRCGELAVSRLCERERDTTYLNTPQ